MTYIHAWTGFGAEEFQTQKNSFNSLLFWTVGELLGRSSVPLLSVISGWLVVDSLRRRSYRDFLTGKAKTLLAPMALWNIVALGVALAAWKLFGFKAPQQLDAAWLINEIGHIWQWGGSNYPTAFLRDIFVCMAFAPLLLRAGWRGLLATAVFALIWSIADWKLYILLRPQILLFFLVGIAVRKGGFATAVQRWPLAPLLIGFMILGGVKVYEAARMHALRPVLDHWHAGLDNLLRLLAAVLAWRLALYLTRTRLAPTLIGWEKYSFLIFCTHLITLQPVSLAASYIIGRMDQPLWPVYFLLNPAFALVMTMLLARVLLVYPPFAEFMSGGRLKAPPMKKAPLGAP